MHVIYTHMYFFTAVLTPLSSAADSLLPIVQSQRERFRLRAQELEAVSKTHMCGYPSTNVLIDSVLNSKPLS